MADTALYRSVWRWHFYAGLFVLPFVLILSISGAIYLFKPQIDRWEERDYRGLSQVGTVSADAQLEAVLGQYPGTRFHHYRLPEAPGDAAMIQLGEADGTRREVYVSPQGEVLGEIAPDGRISALVAKFHGSLMLGRYGDWLVELAASWTIVMILTGLYMWWPRPFRAGGTLWPRLSLRGRPLLRDLHRVTGFWIAGLVLVMLASGLPWAGAWGTAFKWARAELGLVEGAQDWKIGAGPEQEAAGSGFDPVALVIPPAHAHAGHDHGPAAPPPENATDARGLPPGQPLSVFVASAGREGMAFPVLVMAPYSPQKFGPPNGAGWTVKSEPQNRPLGRSVTFSPASGQETGRTGFADQHPVDRAVGYGIAWHEGQLFGLANQLIGLATALALIALSVIGTVMWLKRRPTGKLGAPTAPSDKGARKLLLAALTCGVLLPLFGLSLILMAAIDFVIGQRRQYGSR
ncbi:PepSY domain-containing protein [Leptolyngbya sp. 15MV]|nr:PepSY domain-containing protein [Leptolyngbya sp. 15MV]